MDGQYFPCVYACIACAVQRRIVNVQPCRNRNYIRWLQYGWNYTDNKTHCTAAERREVLFLWIKTTFLTINRWMNRSLANQFRLKHNKKRSEVILWVSVRCWASIGKAKAWTNWYITQSIKISVMRNLILIGCNGSLLFTCLSRFPDRYTRLKRVCCHYCILIYY